MCIHPQFWRHLHHASVRLAEVAEKVSDRVHIAEVTFDGLNPIAGEPFCNVYQGNYKSRAIAIKVPRLFGTQVWSFVLRRCHLFKTSLQAWGGFAKKIAIHCALRHDYVYTLLGAVHPAANRRMGWVIPWAWYGNIMQYFDWHGWSNPKALQFVSHLDFVL